MILRIVPPISHAFEPRSPAAVTTIATEASETHACIPAGVERRRSAGGRARSRRRRRRTVKERALVREEEFGLDGLQSFRHCTSSASSSTRKSGHMVGLVADGRCCRQRRCR
eukprot:3319159-Prymnesium_polylepis.1